MKLGNVSRRQPEQFFDKLVQLREDPEDCADSSVRCNFSRKLSDAAPTSDHTADTHFRRSSGGG